MHEMTSETQAAIKKATEEFSRDTLISSGKKVSDRYRSQMGERKRLNKLQEAAAYAVSRMPATYGAAHFALTQSLQAAGISQIRTCLDCGSGTGAVALAATDILQPEKLFLLEREPAMAEICRRILDEKQIGPMWLENSLPDAELPSCELVTEGYMLVELPEQARIPAVLKMWDAASEMLVLIEPGTPEGFSVIQTAKKVLAEMAYLAAPCAADHCPMERDDWCHFSVRISRDQLHKQIKSGSAPYEDEKFCYAAFSRKAPPFRTQCRILRHPLILPGKITAEMCTADGIVQKVFTKKDPLWKRVRKIKWGDSLEMLPDSDMAQCRTDCIKKDRSNN